MYSEKSKTLGTVLLVITSIANYKCYNFMVLFEKITSFFTDVEKLTLPKKTIQDDSILLRKMKY